MASTDKKIVFITGGNTGLGLEIVKALAKSTVPYEIIIGSRSVANGESAISEAKAAAPNTPSTFFVIATDLESDTSLEAAVKLIGSTYGRLDVLINNGGASFDVPISKGELSLREGFNKTWDINVSGTHVLTTLSVPLLLKSADPRLIFITSGTASMTETDTSAFPALARINASPPAGWPKDAGLNPVTTYRTSKAGLNMLLREWHRILREDGVKVWNVSPGFLATGLAGVGADQLRKLGALEPHIGGEFVRDVVQGKRDADVGKVIRNEGKIQPW